MILILDPTVAASRLSSWGKFRQTMQLKRQSIPVQRLLRVPHDLTEGDGAAEVARAFLEHVDAPEHVVRLQPGSFKVPSSTRRCHLAAVRLSTHARSLVTNGVKTNDI